MKKIFWATLMCLTLMFVLLPAKALAAAVFVGDTDVSGGGYWLNDPATGGIKSDGASADSYNVHYDTDTGTLTLKNAKITQNHKWD